MFTGSGDFLILTREDTEVHSPAYKSLAGSDRCSLNIFRPTAEIRLILVPKAGSSISNVSPWAASRVLEPAKSVLVSQVFSGGLLTNVSINCCLKSLKGDVEA